MSNTAKRHQTRRKAKKGLFSPWPALLPMRKSAVHAELEAIEAYQAT